MENDIEFAANLLQTALSQGAKEIELDYYFKTHAYLVDNGQFLEKRIVGNQEQGKTKEEIIKDVKGILQATAERGD
ncbi:MAG: hypothetical protein ACLTMM_09180 [Lachnospiraceae bacterium]|nr:MAG TPA: hypothetical protein [Caudoviricetes sp.]